MLKQKARTEISYLKIIVKEETGDE
jgi:hypothetical protein